MPSTLRIPTPDIHPPVEAFERGRSGELRMSRSAGPCRMCSLSVLAACAHGWACLFMAACSSVPHDVPSDRSAQTRWSPPVALTQAEGAVRHPDLALTGSGAYIVDFSIVSASTASGENSGTPANPPKTRLRIRSPVGTWMDGPPGSFSFAYPRAAVGTDGTLHLVWGELPAGLMDSMPRTPLSWDVESVWHASLQGERWSVPNRLYGGLDVSWDRAQTSSLVADREGHLHFAFAAVDSAQRGELVHLRLEGGHWSRGRARIGDLIGPPVYTDLSAGDGGDVAIAYVAYHRDSVGDHTNTLFVTRSTDDGRTWTEPYRATQPEQGPAYEPRLARQGDTLHLLWTQSAAADANQTVALWHAVSIDGGTRWRSPSRYPLSGMTHQLQAMAAPCAGVFVAISDFSRLRLLYARLDGGAEARMVAPFGGIGGSPVLRMAADGTLHLVWTETVLSGPDDSVGRTRLMHSTLQACTDVRR